jgi:hypothetical protein
MAKGRPPPAFLQRGRAAAPPPMAAPRRAPAPPPRRAPAPPPMEPDADDMGGGGAPAFRKGGKVGGSFPMGKSAKMPRK